MTAVGDALVSGGSEAGARMPPHVIRVPVPEIQLGAESSGDAEAEHRRAPSRADAPIPLKSGLKVYALLWGAYVLLCAIALVAPQAQVAGYPLAPMALAVPTALALGVGLALAVLALTAATGHFRARVRAGTPGLGAALRKRPVWRCVLGGAAEYVPMCAAIIAIALPQFLVLRGVLGASGRRDSSELMYFSCILGMTLPAIGDLRARWRRCRDEALARGTCAAVPPEREPDPAAVAISKHWPPGGDPPDLSEIHIALRVLPPVERSRAQIVCLGELEVPEVGDARFEPKILSPARLGGRHLLSWIWAGGVIAVTLWLWFAMRRMRLARVLPILLVFCLPAVLAWLWRTMIRPRYVRLAPGMVQVLVYRWPWSAAPVVRSYPITGGTVAVVSRDGAGLALALSRESREDRLSLRASRDGDPVLQRVWQALLSTAPTPPLSETELVG